MWVITKLRLIQQAITTVWCNLSFYRWKWTLLTSFLDPAFLDDVLVAHGGFSSSPVLPVWWRWRDSRWGVVGQFVWLKLSQPFVWPLDLRPPTSNPPVCQLVSHWDVRVLSVFLSFSLSHNHFLFPPPVDQTWPSLAVFCLSLFLVLLTSFNFFTPLFLSFPPSSSLFTVFLPASFSQTFSPSSSSTFRHSSGESAWKETEAEKEGRKKHTQSRSVDRFAHTANAAGCHLLFRALTHFPPPCPFLSFLILLAPSHHSAPHIISSSSHVFVFSFLLLFFRLPSFSPSFFSQLFPCPFLSFFVPSLLHLLLSRPFPSLILATFVGSGLFIVLYNCKFNQLGI